MRQRQKGVGRGRCQLWVSWISLIISGVLSMVVVGTPGVAAAKKTSLTQRRTALGAVLGLSSSGLAMRQHWGKRWGMELSAYSTFGSRFGVLALSTQAQFTFKRDEHYRIYAFAPLRWMLHREPTVHGLNFGPDQKTRTLHLFRAGLGGGAELFLGPYVALAFELPVALQLSTKPVIYDGLGSPSYRRRRFMIAPNAGIHVYFR